MFAGQPICSRFANVGEGESRHALHIIPLKLIRVSTASLSFIFKGAHGENGNP